MPTRIKEIQKLISERSLLVKKHKGRQALDCRLRAKVTKQLQAEIRSDKMLTKQSSRQNETVLLSDPATREQALFNYYQAERRAGADPLTANERMAEFAKRLDALPSYQVAAE